MIDTITNCANHSQLRTAFISIAAILLLACNNSNAPENLTTRTASDSLIGSIQITVSTTGAKDDLDHDGYTISIDNGRAADVAVNDTFTSAPLKKGSHLVRLSGIAGNCSTSATDRWVDVVSDKEVVQVSFAVSCGNNYWDY